MGTGILDPAFSSHHASSLPTMLINMCFREMQPLERTQQLPHASIEFVPETQDTRAKPIIHDVPCPTLRHRPGPAEPRPAALGPS